MTRHKQMEENDENGNIKYQDDSGADESDGYTFASWSSSYISESDENQTDKADVLDLERMANAFEEMRKNKACKVVDAIERARYIALAEADFDMIRHTDKYLKETYEFYYEPALDHAPQIKRQTKALIDKLLLQPHFYCPGEREESTELHVSRWLNNCTDRPEREEIGFTTKDPYEPVRFIRNVEPRMSTSETNVILGKRKRSADIDDEDRGSVYVSSSDTRLVTQSARRPKKMRFAT